MWIDATGRGIVRDQPKESKVADKVGFRAGAHTRPRQNANWLWPGRWPFRRLEEGPTAAEKIHRLGDRKHYLELVAASRRLGQR